MPAPFIRYTDTGLGVIRSDSEKPRRKTIWDSTGRAGEVDEWKYIHTRESKGPYAYEHLYRKAN